MLTEHCIPSTSCFLFFWAGSQQNYLTQLLAAMCLFLLVWLLGHKHLSYFCWRDLLILSTWMVVGTRAWEYGRSNQCPAYLLTAQSYINRVKVREEATGRCSQFLPDWGGILVLSFPHHLTIASAAFSSVPCSVSCGVKPCSALWPTQPHWVCCGSLTCLLSSLQRLISTDMVLPQLPLSHHGFLDERYSFTLYVWNIIPVLVKRLTWLG